MNEDDLLAQLQALRLQLKNAEEDKMKAVEEERRKTEVEMRKAVEEERRKAEVEMRKAEVEMRKAVEEERRKAVEEERRKAEEERRKEEEAMHISKGLPPIVWTHSTQTTKQPSEGTVTFVQSDFAVFEHIVWDMRANCFLRKIVADSNEVSCEVEIQDFVKYVLDDVCKSISLRNCSIRREFNLDSKNTGNVVVIVSPVNAPIAVVEVKKEDDPFTARNYRQLLTYMDLVCAGTGLSFVFGALTNYKKWQVCWSPCLPPSLVNAKTLNEAEVDSLQALVSDDENDILYGSEVYDIETNVDLVPRLIATFLHKTYISSKQPLSLRDGSTAYTVALTNTTMRRSLPRNFDLHHGRFPNAQAKEFYLRRPLGGGLHGVVWEAVTKSGSHCAIKFARATSNLQKEMNAWHAQGCSYVRVTTLLGKDALIMPYAVPVQSVNKEDISDLQEIVDLLAAKGIVHDDVKPEHLGRLHDGKIVLLDFGRTIPDEDNAKAAMLKKLQEICNALLRDDQN